MNQIIREEIEVGLHPNNMKGEDGFSLSRLMDASNFHPEGTKEGVHFHSAFL
jgi:hypothetical protein